MIINFSDKDRRQIEQSFSDKGRLNGMRILNSFDPVNTDELISCLKCKNKLTVKWMIIDYLTIHGYYSRKQMADKLGVYIRYIETLHKKNKLKSIKIGKSLYFSNNNYIRNGYPRTINRTATGGNARSERDI